MELVLNYRKKSQLMIKLFLYFVTAVSAGLILLIAFFLMLSRNHTNKVLQDSRLAFQTEKPLIKSTFDKKSIQELSTFLLQNIDTLNNYNRHKEYRTIELNLGNREIFYRNFGNCFSMPTLDQNFIEEYIPENLIDSFYFLSQNLPKDIVKEFTVCNQYASSNIESTEGSVRYTLKSPTKTNWNYYLSHSIIQNSKYNYLINNTINSIYDAPLCKKDTVIGKLEYIITVEPYRGI